VDGQGALPEAHAATDVVADEVRVDEPFGEDGGTDGNAFAGVQVRQADGGGDAGQGGGVFQLLDGGAFDPGCGRGVEANFVAEDLR
jgi:hypothetical protein